MSALPALVAHYFLEDQIPASVEDMDELPLSEELESAYIQNSFELAAAKIKEIEECFTELRSRMSNDKQ